MSEYKALPDNQEKNGISQLQTRDGCQHIYATEYYLFSKLKTQAYSFKRYFNF